MSNPSRGLRPFAPTPFGGYTLLTPLATGGMGEVFLARPADARPSAGWVVIKKILPHLAQDSAFIRRFLDEARLVVVLNHVSIARLLDMGAVGDEVFIAMEYVDGKDLRKVAGRLREQKRPFPTELALFVVSRVLDGLGYAHRKRNDAGQELNLVHRDVSPQNVLLSWEGEVKLTDFGIAKARTTVTGTDEVGVLKGKYAYMSPEQALGREVDGRTDLYAVGIVLYETLSGVNPFVSPSAYDTLKRVRDGQVRPLEEVLSTVPDELAVIVRRAMSYSVDERHANAGRLYEDLIQFLYASSRRVGAHELSEYLADVRAASESGQVIDSDEHLLAAFDESEALLPAPTPADLPSGRSSARRASFTTGLGRAPAASVSRPVVEIGRAHV